MRLFFDLEEDKDLYSASEGEKLINLPASKITILAKTLVKYNFCKFYIKDRRGTFLYTIDNLGLIKKFNDLKKVGLSNKTIADILKEDIKKSQPNDTSWADHLNDSIWRRL